MTDNEIIKALECCTRDTYHCKECQLYVERKCMRKLNSLALDLINRQKSEIKKIDGQVTHLIGYVKTLKAEKDDLKIELQAMRNAANGYKAEVERLQKEQDLFADIGKMYSEIKAEAVKEVAEKVRNTTWYHINSQGKLVVGANSEIHIPLYKAEDIDKILKETVGDADG